MCDGRDLDSFKRLSCASLLGQKKKEQFSLTSGFLQKDLCFQKWCICFQKNTLLFFMTINNGSPIPIYGKWSVSSNIFVFSTFLLLPDAWMIRKISPIFIYQCTSLWILSLILAFYWVTISHSLIVLVCLMLYMGNILSFQIP